MALRSPWNRSMRLLDHLGPGRHGGPGERVHVRYEDVQRDRGPAEGRRGGEGPLGGVPEHQDGLGDAYLRVQDAATRRGQPELLDRAEGLLVEGDGGVRVGHHDVRHHGRAVALGGLGGGLNCLVSGHEDERRTSSLVQVNTGQTRRAHTALHRVGERRWQACGT